jgi:predicted esterase
MKYLTLALALSCGPILLAAPASSRVPPPGIRISEASRAELQTRADALANDIATYRNNATDAAMLELLPDIQIFHKAVGWSLRYDEFYRSNEVALARTLLQQGRDRLDQLRAGKPEWLNATGLIVRGYTSRIDGSVQPYGLVVPSSFAGDRTRLRRLDVWLHGRDNNLTELKFIGDRQRSSGEFTPADTIVLHPYGRYCNAFKFAGEVDVFEAMEHVKKSYRIDDRRIALRGFSMGGAGVWHLAAHHPATWAIAAPGAGFAETAEYQKLGTNRARFPWWEQKLWQWYDATDYAANFHNLPVVAYNGTDDPQRQAADVMERALKDERLSLRRVWGTNVGHKYTPDAKVEIIRFVDEAIASAGSVFPEEVHFSTRTLRYNRARGITVLGLDEHWQRADVRLARTPSGDLEVTTRNVRALSLALPPGIAPAEIQIDGRRVSNARPVTREGTTSYPALIKDGRGRWRQVAALQDDTLEKRPRLQGPIDDAFMDAFLVVRPTARDRHEARDAWVQKQLAAATNEWRAQFRGDAPVKDDSAVSDSDIAERNLILFGTPGSNRLLSRIVEKLPVRWDASTVRLGRQSFSSETHVPVLIFPNPLNPKRYVVLNSGFTFAAAGKGSNAQQTPKLPDYAIVSLADNKAILAGFFDEQWRLP